MVVVTPEDIITIVVLGIIGIYWAYCAARFVLHRN
jgi:hypothetical protein